MASFSSYYIVGLVIPSVLLSAIYLFSTIVSSILMLLTKQVQDEGCVYRLPFMVRVIIGAVLAVRIKPVKQYVALYSQEKPRYFELYIHHKRLKKTLSLIGILFNVFMVIGCSFVTLWTVLLVEESTTCDKVGFDCFSNKKEVTDCKNDTTAHINGTDYQLECYRIAFDYIGGLAAAGGVTFFSAVVANVLMIVLVAISDIRSVICRWIFIILLLTFFILSPIAVILCNIYIPTLEEPSFLDKFRLWVYFLSFHLAITSCILLSPDVLLDISIPCFDVIAGELEDVENDSYSVSDYSS